MATSDNTRTIKSVVLGDGAVGKSCMLISYACNRFPEEHAPTVFGTYFAPVRIDANDYEGCPRTATYKLLFFDTAGQEDYNVLRRPCYPRPDVFLVCFSVVNPSSMENVCEKWVPEVRKYCSKASVLLVGTQIDLREDRTTLENLAKAKQKPSTREQGERLAKKIKAFGYVECSAKTRHGLKEVFDQVVVTVLENPMEANKENPTEGEETAEREPRCFSCSIL